MKHLVFTLAAASLALLGATARAESLDEAQVRAFIAQLVRQHHFEKGALERALHGAALQRTVLERIAKPAEAKPWHEYRRIFVTDARIDSGVAFWREHANALERTEQRTGVPPEIILGILGVETTYGKNTGGFRVIDALGTLAFHYPKRAAFFRQELEQFLLLCREEGRDPLAPMGSYAGAMGLPQFMPSSFRHFADDFDSDGRRDIWQNPGDAIASVARYFVASGWHGGEAVAFPVEVSGSGVAAVLDKDLRPRHNIGQLRAAGVSLVPGLAADIPAKLVDLQETDGPAYWVGLHNFYVITRYNHSALYAMAVHELGQAIKVRRQREMAS